MNTTFTIFDMITRFNFAESGHVSKVYKIMYCKGPPKRQASTHFEINHCVKLRNNPCK